jgi:S-adenosylmethionine:tRNA ribosyltransferase-isomerase
LLVIDRRGDGLIHSHFGSLGSFLSRGDLLVVNRSRVIPARLVGARPGGGNAEVLLVRRHSSGEWDALLRPARRLKPGGRVEIAEGVSVTVLSGPLADGRRRVRLECAPLSEAEALRRYGSLPLPPYITRQATAEDEERYQTVFAREDGSVAAPTAGLHFTPELLTALAAEGIDVTEVLLHVGPGTFQPIRDPEVLGHKLAPEWCFVPPEAADCIARTRAAGGRVIAVGTTVTRTLESAASEGGLVTPGAREANIFVTPGYRFRVVDGLITNFHLPRSSLLVLVSAFAGRERILRAYREAIRCGYRFYSYGDACLIQ